MNRDEAVGYVKEVTSICTDMTPDAISLIESKLSDKTSTGYRVHIKAFLDCEVMRHIKTIAEKRGLAVKEEKDSVIIYKPKIS